MVTILATDVAYLAGLFDGEGNVYHNDQRLTLSLTNTDLDVVVWLEALCGGWLHEQKVCPAEDLQDRGWDIEAVEPHGTNQWYRQGCRCERCREAHNATERARRAARHEREYTMILD